MDAAFPKRRKSGRRPAGFTTSWDYVNDRPIDIITEVIGRSQKKSQLSAKAHCTSNSGNGSAGLIPPVLPQPLTESHEVHPVEGTEAGLRHTPGANCSACCKEVYPNACDSSSKVSTDENGQYV